MRRYPGLPSPLVPNPPGFPLIYPPSIQAFLLSHLRYQNAEASQASESQLPPYLQNQKQNKEDYDLKPTDLSKKSSTQNELLMVKEETVDQDNLHDENHFKSNCVQNINLECESPVRHNNMMNESCDSKEEPTKAVNLPSNLDMESIEKYRLLLENYHKIKSYDGCDNFPISENHQQNFYAQRFLSAIHRFHDIKSSNNEESETQVKLEEPETLTASVPVTEKPESLLNENFLRGNMEQTDRLPERESVTTTGSDEDS